MHVHKLYSSLSYKIRVFSFEIEKSYITNPIFPHFLNISINQVATFTTCANCRQAPSIFSKNFSYS